MKPVHFKTKFIVVFFLFFPLAFSTALEVPQWQGAVNDAAFVLQDSTKVELTNFLNAVHNQTGVQGAVLTVPSLQGDSIEDFSIRVADAWQLGEKEKNNGVLLVVAVKEKEVRIEVGYGLEPLLTDAKSGLIIRNVIIPEFKNGNYNAGIYNGIRSIIGIATNNETIVSKNIEKNDENEGSFFGFFVFILFMFMMFGGIGRRRYRSGGWIGPFIFGSMLSNNRHKTTWTNSSSSHKNTFGGGGFGGSSFGGGGFSGGGGRFGGGGASGKW